MLFQLLEENVLNSNASDPLRLQFHGVKIFLNNHLVLEILIQFLSQRNFHDDLIGQSFFFIFHA